MYGNYYNYGNNYGRGYSGAPGLSGLALVIMIAVLLLALFQFIAWCKMFRKADQPWERMFVPIYGAYWTYEIADAGYLFWLNIGMNFLYWVLGFVIPNVDVMMVIAILMTIGLLVVHVFYCVRLARAFGKGGGFAAGLVLLYPIFIIMLGFGSAEYCLPQQQKGTTVPDWKCPDCGTINPAHRGACENCGASKR